MTRINFFISDRGTESLIFLTPLLVNRALLKDMGVTLGFFSREEDGLFDADCIFFENRVYRNWGREGQEDRVYSLLDRMKRRVDKVFWVDTTDGTGTTQFQFLPLVDGYYKTQILKQRLQYTKSYYGNRIYTDYYHAQFGVNDTDERHSVATAPESELSKIQPAWNDSLGDFGRWGKYVRRLRSYLPIMPIFYSARFVPPQSRTIDVNGRFGASYRRETVAFQRSMVREKLSQLGVPTEKLLKKHYLRELELSKVAISPFGWGEPTYKDYETIISGAMLMKPDLSHIDTWPDLYREGETYLSFKWDCSDLGEVLEEALASDKWREIATEAQDTYRKYLFEPAGRQEFCNRLIKLAAGTA
jgi:hypothetical protein